MKKKTKGNVYTAFVGEAKAYFRLLAYAEKAAEEELPQIALLFRAIADSLDCPVPPWLTVASLDE